MKHIIDDADKNKYEALSKAEVIALLQQVIESGQLPEGELEGLVISLRNPIDNLDYKIAFCSQAKYNELKAAEQLEANCYYIITDDTSYEDLDESLKEIKEQIASLDQDRQDIQDLKQDVTSLKNKKLYAHYMSIKGTGTDIYNQGTTSIDVKCIYFNNSSDEITTVEAIPTGKVRVNSGTATAPNGETLEGIVLERTSTNIIWYDGDLMLPIGLIPESGITVLHDLPLLVLDLS
jgi:hypothetical protein